MAEAAKKSILKNIPPKTRVTIFLVTVVILIAVYAFFSAFFSGGSERQQFSEAAGQASIGVTGETLATAKGEQIAAGGTSLELELTQAQDDLVEQQRGESGSFIERLELENDVQMYEEAGNITNAPPRIENPTDAITGRPEADAKRRGEYRDRQQELTALRLQRERTASLSGDGAYGATAASGSSYQMALASFNEDAFLQRELDTVRGSSVEKALSEVKAIHDAEFSVSSAGKGKQSAGSGAAPDGIAGYNRDSGLGPTFSGLERSGDAGYGQYLGRDVSGYVGASLATSQAVFDSVSTESGNDVRVNLEGITGGQQTQAAPQSLAQSGAPEVNQAPRQEQVSAMDDLMSPASFQGAAQDSRIMPGDQFYAILDIGVNTDEISPIRGTIVQPGRLQGAVFIGEPQRMGTKAILNLTRLTVGKRSYSISAVAQDPVTNRTAVRDDVDHHIMERYGKLVLAAGLEGYADALSRTRTVERSDGSTETIQDGLPDSEDQALYAAGRVGQVLVPKFEAGFDRPPTVTVNAGREIVIMFLGELDLESN